MRGRAAGLRGVRTGRDEQEVTVVDSDSKLARGRQLGSRGRRNLGCHGAGRYHEQPCHDQYERVDHIGGPLAPRLPPPLAHSRRPTSLTSPVACAFLEDIPNVPRPCQPLCGRSPSHFHSGGAGPSPGGSGRPSCSPLRGRRRTCRSGPRPGEGPLPRRARRGIPSTPVRLREDHRARGKGLLQRRGCHRLQVRDAEDDIEYVLVDDQRAAQVRGRRRRRDA